MRILILGGTGFVGSHLVNALSRLGHEIIIPTRSREKHKENLILIPKVHLLAADIHDPKQMKKMMEGCDVVINLVGILNERGNNGEGFYKAHVELAENIITCCYQCGISRVLQMSALNADSQNGPSYYLRSKGKAEALFRNSGLDVTCYQPSVIFGPHDSFFNRFAELLKRIPLVFPLACPEARFAPVYVIDVVELMIKTLDDSRCYQQTYQLGGPREFTLKELVIFTRDSLGMNTIILPLNNSLSLLQARIFDCVPGKPFSTDNYLSTQRDSVCTVNAFEKFAITPMAIEAVVPSYLNKDTLTE